MPKRLPQIPLLLMLGGLPFLQPLLPIATPPAAAQSLTPHFPQLDLSQLEQRGLGLLQEAFQLAQLQQVPLALARAKLAVQLAPNRPESWAILGSLSLQSNQIEPGIGYLKRAQSLDPRNPAILFSLGNAYFQQAKYLESIQAIQAGLKLKPDTPGALFDLGNAYLMLKRPQDAITNYEKAFAQDKRFWPALNNVGLVKYEQGQVEESLKLWQQSVAIDATAIEAKLAAAVALYAKGDREAALIMGETAIKADGRYGSVKFLKENLWGERLLNDTQRFFAVPQMQATIAQNQPEKDPQKPDQPVDR